MEKYFKVLRKCSLFNNISDENLMVMLKCLNGRIVSFDKNYTIIAEGYPAKYIGIMLSGSAQTVLVDYDGNRSIVSKTEASEVFGEAFACADVSAVPVAVIADEPCEVMLIESSHVLHTCGNNCGFHQQLIFNLMKDLAIKNLMLHQKMEITSKRSTREKLMTYLMLQSKRQNSRSFDIPFDRQSLADYLMVDRSGLSAEISRLRKERIIESRKNHFELL